MQQHKRPAKEGTVAESKKMHDIWAFILYVISFSALVALSYRIGKPLEFLEELKTYTKSATLFDLGFSLLPISISALTFIVGNVAFAAFPSAIIHTSFVLMIASTAVLGVMGLMSEEGGGAGRICGLLTVLSSFALVLYYLHCKRYIPYVAAILRNTTRIYRKSPFFVVGLVVVSYVLQTALLLSTAMLLYNSEGEKGGEGWNLASLAFGAFNIYWGSSIVIYAMRVYTTKGVLVFMQNKKFRKSASMAWEGLARVARSIGTIALAALLVALVETLRYLVRMSINTSYQRTRNGYMQIFIIIIGFIAMLALAILRGIIEFANTFTLCYNALHGTSYKVSLERAFDLFKDTHVHLWPWEGLIMTAVMMISISFLVALAGLWTLYHYLKGGWASVVTAADLVFEAGGASLSPQGAFRLYVRIMECVLIILTVMTISEVWMNGAFASIFIREESPALFRDSCPKADEELLSIESALLKGAS